MVLNGNDTDCNLLPNYSNNSYSELSHRDLYYEIQNNVIYLHFDFFNGAFDTNKCIRLQSILHEISLLKQEIVVLMGGYQYFGNGINLNTIESSENSELESFRNINAIDNVIQTIFTSFNNKLIISAISGNCGAGGCMLALSADLIWTHENIIFNPHYKLMGLYGSEYWTEFLVKRVGTRCANELTDICLPISAKHSLKIGLIDEIIGKDSEDFRIKLIEKLDNFNKIPCFLNILKSKYKQKKDLNWIKKAENHRTYQMYNMMENFQSHEYKENRQNFVNKIYKKRIITNDDSSKLLSIINNKETGINYNTSTKILYGKQLAIDIQNQLKCNIIDFLECYQRVPKLSIICVGFDNNLDLYTRNKVKTASKIGMEAELIRLNENTNYTELSEVINNLNNDNCVDGIIIQLPLPSHLTDDLHSIVNLISSYKDVDGLTMFSNNRLRGDTLNNCKQLIFQNNSNYYNNLDNNYINIPCVPVGIMQCLYSELPEYSLKGKHAVIIGNSLIVGAPMQEILLSMGMTVTCTHKYTKYLSDITAKADLIVTATGVPHLFKKDWLKNGSVIFDIGISYKDNKLCGDVDINGMMDYIYAITPVPGGIGPLTVCSVLSNTINSAKWRQLNINDKQHVNDDRFVHLVVNGFEKQKQHQILL